MSSFARNMNSVRDPIETHWKCSSIETALFFGLGVLFYKIFTLFHYCCINAVCALWILSFYIGL